MILQQLCRNNTDWDQPLPDELRPQWEDWRQDLHNLSNLKIQRCYKPSEFGTFKSAELHHFSDASLTGYGQCSYLRQVDMQGQVYCSLVMAKARVAPLKPVTIPRLELQAAVVSVKICALLNHELANSGLKNIFWTDSKVVLGYIKNEARRFHIFVANRIQRIHESSSPDQWRYVSTNENPADFASRGLKANELTTSNWFQGPPFLWKEEIPAESTSPLLITSDDPEVKRVQVMATGAIEKTALLDKFTKYSDWSRLQSAVSILLKRCARKSPEAEIKPQQARDRATRTIMRMVQRDSFREDIEDIEQDGRLKKGSKLSNLDPFLDKEGLLRVGGRMRRSSCPQEIKHPLILPKKSHVTLLIIRDSHDKIAHQGRGMTMNQLRSQGIWIIGCSAAVSSYLFKCVTCKRIRGTAQSQKMADLPVDRIEPSPPFTHCGVDCFGPFLVKELTMRR
ncbi:uncharacterized protein LOC135499961 [Lineus longissimus]|uniref:uncharacterized protein LOC135499961 n=1 Tax=Lineus longissimus TaxID=88925 RepID=UPI00315C66C9